MQDSVSAHLHAVVSYNCLSLTCMSPTQVWGAVRGFGSIAQWSAPVGLERISAELLVSSLLLLLL